MKIRLSDLRMKVKTMGELLDYIEMTYPDEKEFIERLDKDFLQLNDLLFNVDVSKMVNEERVWVDTNTGEIEYEQEVE